MLKIIIVEDELPILRGLKIMIEKISSNYHVVNCSKNGKEALEFIRDNEVDVIITDINMPVINGISLIEKVNIVKPDVKKVIISGYSEFKYAQQGIKLGVKAYLLKPIIKDEVEKILNSIDRELDLNDKKNEKTLLKELVYTGKKTPSDRLIQIIYMCVGPLMKSGFEESVDECNFWNGVSIEEICSTKIDHSDTLYSFDKNMKNEKILLISSKKKVNLQDICKLIKEEIDRKGYQFSAVYYGEFIKMSDIPVTSHILRRFLEKNIRICQSYIWEYKTELSDNTDKSNSIGINKKVSVSEMKNILKNFDVKQREAIHLIRNLMNTYSDYYILDDDMIWNILLYSKNKNEIISNTVSILNEKFSINNKLSTEEIVKKIEAYVENNMNEDISVASIAAEFGFVAPYISRIFKDKKGITLSQYILKVRIDKAKSLLEVSDMVLAKDVAIQVGYKDPLHFSKIFKKKVGVYPSEYKKEFSSI